MCWELVGQDDMEVQLHVLTCRILHQLENLIEMVWRDRWPPWLRIMKSLGQAVVLDRQKEHFNM